MFKSFYKKIPIIFATILLVFLGGFFVVQNKKQPKEVNQANQNTQNQAQNTKFNLKNEILSGKKAEQINSSKLPENLKNQLLNKTAAAGIKEVKIQGKLQVFLADDSNQALYQIEENGKVKEIYFLEEPENLKSQESVTIQGLVIDESVVVENTQAPNFLAATVYKASTTGTHNVLVILHNFSNLTFLNNSSTVDDAISKAAVDANTTTNTNSVRNFYTENSYGNFTTNTTVTNLLTSSYDYNLGCDITQIIVAAEAAAANAGYAASNYDHIVYLFPYMPTCQIGGSIWAGLGAFPGSVVFLNGYYDLKTIAHELGHNLGVGHANSLDCGAKTVDIYANCTETEYGDYYDTMGSGYYHFKASFKESLGWLSGKIQTVSSTGSYTIYPYENMDNNLKALKIAKPDTNEYYYLEYRQATGFDATLGAGVTRGGLLHVGDGLGNDTMLLDAVPGEATNDWDTVALLDTSDFTDQVNSASVIQNSHNSSALTVEIAVLSDPDSFFTVTNGLWLSNVNPLVGDSVNGYYQVKNNTGSSLTIDLSLVDYAVDAKTWNSFTLKTVTIPANSTANFTGTHTITGAGLHHTWLAFLYNGTAYNFNSATGQLMDFWYGAR